MKTNKENNIPVLIGFISILLAFGTIMFLINRNSVRNKEEVSNSYRFKSHINSELLPLNVNKNYFEKISIVDNTNIPSNYIDKWDVSQKQDQSIMEWYVDEDNNGMYEMYLGFKNIDKTKIEVRDIMVLFIYYPNIKVVDFSKIDLTNYDIPDGTLGTCTTAYDKEYCTNQFLEKIIVMNEESKKKIEEKLNKQNLEIVVAK